MNALSPSSRGLELHHDEIDRLPADLKAALAAACTQRQAEVYRAYARRTNTPTAAGFDNLLNAIWGKIQRRQDHGSKEHLQWQRRAESLYPADSPKSDIYHGNAQIAVIALLHSNNALWTRKAQDTCYAAHQSFFSIYNTLTVSLGGKPQFDVREPGVIEIVFAHPLIAAEHRRQERDLSELQ